MDKFMVESEMNFMYSVQNYLIGYINIYLEHGLITEEQKEKIKTFHNSRIDNYVDSRLRGVCNEEK